MPRRPSETCFFFCVCFFCFPLSPTLSTRLSFPLSVPAKTPGALPPLAVPPGHPDGPLRRPPARSGAAGCRHAHRGAAAAARGPRDSAEARLLGHPERGRWAGCGAGRGARAEDGWPRLRAPAVRARPPAAAALRPGYGQSPRGCGSRGRSPAHLGLAGPAAAREVPARPQPSSAPG